MPTIESINTYAAKWTITGWFIGLAYHNWLASSPIHIALWAHLMLIIGGMFASSIIIGGGTALLLLAGLLTKTITGKMEGSPHAFAWASFIAPVLAFFAAKYALQFAASF